MNATYNYYATPAIAICKGEVKKLNRIWVDTTSLSFDEIDYTFYRGTEDQNPDPFMLPVEGEGNIPSLQKHTLYSHQNFPLADYNNHVPVFTFEVDFLQNSSKSSKL